MCGKYTSPGTNGAVLNQPIYDGKRDEWTKEEIDLSSYAGQNVKLRFNLKTDAGLVKDGFYFDDVLIRKISTSTTSLTENSFSSNLIYPNPATTSFNIENFSDYSDYKIFNQLGQIVKNDKLTTQAIVVSDLETGVYHLQLTGKNEVIFTKKLLIAR